MTLVRVRDQNDNNRIVYLNPDFIVSIKPNSQSYTIALATDHYDYVLISKSELDKIITAGNIKIVN